VFAAGGQLHDIRQSRHRERGGAIRSRAITDAISVDLE
jgi:hypothetical protein